MARSIWDARDGDVQIAYIDNAKTSRTVPKDPKSTPFNPFPFSNLCSFQTA